MKFSQKTFKAKLHENPELRQVFIDAVMQLLKAELDADDTKEEVYEFDYSIGADILSKINTETMDMAVAA